MAPTDCLSCLDRAAEVRGVCRRCYQHFRQQVQLGLISWQDLEDADLCLPARRPRDFLMFKEPAHGA
jgi:hypothetical protein